MTQIVALELLAVDLPFRKPFKHAAAERTTSSSLFLKCETECGTVGFGEALPRDYVTGESRDSAFEMLETRILPRLLNQSFRGLREVREFLEACDGQAPTDWVPPDQPQTAAWCVVDLALLDAYGRVTGESICLNENRQLPKSVTCSVVISSTVSTKTLWLIRLGRIRQVKLKVEQTDNEQALRKCRRILGQRVDIRVDANMAWSVDQAEEQMRSLSHFGVTSFEQPIAADDIRGLSELVGRTQGLDVMVDESLSNRESLQTLIDRQATTSVNVRISKCGGLVAAYQRARQALDAGLTLQIGCQVGESSLLSAALLALVQGVPDVTYLEGCFGKLLLRDDPVTPLLQFGFGGRLPRRPAAPGLGVSVDEAALAPYVTRRIRLGP